MAEQLIATKGLADRLDSLWMADAISSFPVPDSPEIRTALSECDILATVSSAFSIVGLRPMISGKSSCQSPY